MVFIATLYDEAREWMKFSMVICNYFLNFYSPTIFDALYYC